MVLASEGQAPLSHAWIRQRSNLSVEPSWHLQQTMSPAGVRITSCAEVLTPDDEVEIAPGHIDLRHHRCGACAAHADARGSA
jgi:hypothetical protein